MTRSLVTGNDGNSNATGDGLNASVVKGNVEIVDGTYDANPAGDAQMNGIYLRDIDGNVLIRQSAPNQLSASDNSTNGIDIKNVGTLNSGGDVLVTGGDFALNGKHGLIVSGSEGRIGNAIVKAVRASGQRRFGRSNDGY